MSHPSLEDVTMPTKLLRRRVLLLIMLGLLAAPFMAQAAQAAAEDYNNRVLNGEPTPTPTP